MSDLIREVVSIQGERLDFCGIIYLERGINPKALLLAKFSSQEGVLGYQSNSNMETLIELVHGIGNQLAFLYDYTMDVRSISDRIDVDGYSHLLAQMQTEWEKQKHRQCTVPCFN